MFLNTYVGETGTVTRVDYATNIETHHHGRVVLVRENIITILKNDGTHIDGHIMDFRLDNPGKFLR